jgi:hypothetical protein
VKLYFLELTYINRISFETNLINEIDTDLCSYFGESVDNKSIRTFFPLLYLLVIEIFLASLIFL